MTTNKKPPDALLNSMGLMGQIMVLGAEGAMEFQRRQLTNKVTTKIRALPGTENAYKAGVRKERRQAKQQLQSLIKATGQEDYEKALKWIKTRGRL